MKKFLAYMALLVGITVAIGLYGHITKEADNLPPMSAGNVTAYNDNLPPMVISNPVQNTTENSGS